MEPWRIENMITLGLTVVLVLGLYALSDSKHALWGLLLLLNVNFIKSK